MQKITLKNIEDGDELIVIRQSKANEKAGVDGYIQRTISYKWIYEEDGEELTHEIAYQLDKAQVGARIGTSHTVVKIED